MQNVILRTMAIVVMAILPIGCKDHPTTQFWKMTVDQTFSDPKVRELVLAMREGDTVRVRQLVDEGVDVNAKGRGGMTPLMRHLYDGGSKDGYTTLLELGADPNILMINGESVMHIAADMDDTFWLEKALDYGGDPNLLNKGNPFGSNFQNWTPLICAITKRKPKNAKLLIERGADLEIPNANGKTPIFFALGNNQYEVVYLLLERNVRTQVRFQDHDHDAIQRIRRRNVGKDEFLEHFFPEEVKWFEKTLELLTSRGIDVSYPPELKAAQEKAQQEREIEERIRELYPNRGSAGRGQQR